jgi:predicted RNA polymerase sigma factor
MWAPVSRNRGWRCRWRILGDLDEAEDMAQEALVEATRRWPVDGVPANPGAWLTTVARNRALNRLRDRRRRGGPPLLLEDGLDAATTGDVAEHADPDGFGDDRLRLVVLCCHPSLGRDAQVALTFGWSAASPPARSPTPSSSARPPSPSGSPGPRGDALGDYHLLAATRADLLRRAGRAQEAAELFRALAADAPTEQQRHLYQRRLSECAGS